MPWPPTLSDGQPVTTAWLNAVAQAPAAWQGQVNANNNDLANINSMSCKAIFGVGAKIGLNTNVPIRDLHLKGQTGQSLEVLLEKPDAGADQKYWRFIVNTDLMTLDAVNDAYTAAASAWMAIRNGLNITHIVFPLGKVSIGTTNATAKLTVVPDSDGQAGLHLLCPSNHAKLFTVIPESSPNAATFGYWAGSQWGNLYVGGTIWSDFQIGAAQFRCGGDLILDNIPTSYPGAGTKKVWADPADGYRLKLAY
jgi:hypothetical protein